MNDNFFGLGLPFAVMNLLTELESSEPAQPETINLSPDDYTVEDMSAPELPTPDEPNLD